MANQPPAQHQDDGIDDGERDSAYGDEVDS
jgi:hypothetical protein